jgi:hypothetical protein
MKAIFFAICVIVGAPSLSEESVAADRDNAGTHNLRFTHRHRAVDSGGPAAQLGGEVSGDIPRALRAGDPLQLINPFAPAKYGTAEENVSFDPDDPGKGNGINLFRISF